MTVYYLGALRHSTDIWLQSPSERWITKTASKYSKSLALRETVTTPGYI